MKARRVSVALFSLALIFVLCGCTLMQCASQIGVANSGDQTIIQGNDNSIDGDSDCLIMLLVFLLLAVVVVACGAAMGR